MKLRTGLMLAVALGSLSFAAIAPAAYSDYLQLDGITGESNPPGFSDTTRIYSLTVGKNTFSETQLVDSTSPLLLVASSFKDGAIAFYKEPTEGTKPYEEILFHNLLLSSYQATTIGPHPGEKVSFQFESPADYLYLKLPGVGGSIPIDSLTLTDNVFSVHKLVDTTSPTLAAAFANSQLFPTSTLLLYTDPAAATPDVSIVFDQALISSIVSDPSGETVSFAATDSTVPEPQGAALLSGNAWAPHKIQGWTPDFVPEVLKRDVAHRILTVTDAEAVETARALARNEGILCGISSGGTFAAALKVAAEAPQGAAILAMLPDTGERYLSTILFEGIPEGSDPEA